MELISEKLITKTISTRAVKSLHFRRMNFHDNFIRSTYVNCISRSREISLSSRAKSFETHSLYRGAVVPRVGGRGVGGEGEEREGRLEHASRKRVIAASPLSRRHAPRSILFTNNKHNAPITSPV